MYVCINRRKYACIYARMYEYSENHLQYQSKIIFVIQYELPFLVDMFNLFTELMKIPF